MRKHRVLVVDDSAAMAQTVARYLANFSFAADCASGGAEALDAFASNPPDVVVTDLRMKDLDGLELLEAMKRINPGVPVIIMTAFGAIDSAIEAMRRGAFDYMTKPFEMDVMRRLLERACRESARRQERDGTPAPLMPPAVHEDFPEGDEADPGQGGQDGFAAQHLLGDSGAMRELRTLIGRVADATSPVLVFGETGVGKELVARAIHAEGPSAGAPFVAVNCAALPDSLLEAELFGRDEPGGFADAEAPHLGLFTQADGGSLFLDEIGDMSIALQSKVLRVLQTGEVRPNGGEPPRPVKVRIIAATHRDLRDLVVEGRFREDLFFRLDVLRVRVPALRERREDIPALVEHFLQRSERRLPGGSMVGFTAEAFQLLCDYGWPGNVRELENLIERLAVTAVVANVGLAEVRDAIGRRRKRDRLSDLVREPMTLAELEDRYIEAVLEKEGGNKTRAAEVLGIDPSTLYRRKKRTSD